MWRGEERTNRRYVRRRESFRAPGSIVLLREADRSLSLSHAALIAYRSPIYVEREGRSHGEAGEDASRRSSPRNAAGCCLDQRERERERRGRDESSEPEKLPTGSAFFVLFIYADYYRTLLQI